MERKKSMITQFNKNELKKIYKSCIAKKYFKKCGRIDKRKFLAKTITFHF